MKKHLVIASAAAVLLVAPRPASALFGVGDVVWDPAAEIKNAAKVAAMLQELAQMKAQLERLKQQIENLGNLMSDPGTDAFGRAGAAMNELTRLQQTLDAWTTRLRINVQPGDVPRGGLPQRQAEIRGYVRERTATLDSALTQVEQQRRQTAGQVATIVTASNAAPGPKAAQQATNDLHAIVAAEQARLETLRAMRQRLAADAEAAGQASRAAVDADLDRDRGDAQFLINNANH